MSAVDPLRPGPRRMAWSTSPAIAAMPRGTVVLVPCGAVEQHGPHLPVGVDAWLSQAVAAAIAERDPAVRVAEPLAYGISPHHAGFAGTVTLRPATFLALVRDVCTSLWRDGLIPVLLNGHGGNRSALDVALTELADGGVRAATFSYFDLIAGELPELEPESVGHACALETSLLLHLWPDAVDRAAIPAGGTPDGWPDPHLWSGGGVSLWRPFEELNPTGVVGRPERATAELGERILQLAVARGADAVGRIRDAISPHLPTNEGSTP